MKVDAYQTYVRPILEYAATVWAPYTQRNISKLKSIQCRAARFVMGDFSTYSSVTTMLATLQWDTLHHRRNLLKFEMLFKIMHNLVQLPLPNHINYNSTTTRGHDYKLSIPFCRINIYKHSFFPSTIPKWNRLPARIVTAETIDSFTNLLTNYLIWYCTTLIYMSFSNYNNNKRPIIHHCCRELQSFDKTVPIIGNLHYTPN